MDKEYTDQLIKIIKKIRIEKNYSQEQFAFDLNISTSYFGMIERGERKLNFNIFLKVTEIFGIQPSKLLNQVEEEMKTQNKKRK